MNSGPVKPNIITSTLQNIHQIMRMLWSGIKSIVNIKNIKFNAISQLVQNGEVIDKPGEMAKVFNHYFIHIASKIDADIPGTRKSPFDYLGSKLKYSFFLSPTDSLEVESIISDFKTGKATGPYSIPCNLLKMIAHSISPALAILINESFIKGIFPEKN